MMANQKMSEKQLWEFLDNAKRDELKNFAGRQWRDLRQQKLLYELRTNQLKNADKTIEFLSLASVGAAFLIIVLIMI